MDSTPTGHQAGPFTCPDDHPTALTAVASRLRCPHCTAAPLHHHQRSLACPAGHSFDIARQGYVSLLTGRHRHLGDSTTMVAARERFLGRDHYRPLRSTITALAAEHAPTGLDLVVDLAGGTGHYLTPVLEARPGALGLTVDVSTAALRRAARAHPRAAAAAADLRGPLPIATGAAGVVLSVFGPRPAAEIERVLDAHGVLVIATALPEHLHELRERLGTLVVDPRKTDRLRDAFSGFDPVAEQTVTWRLALEPDAVADLAAMGPSAHHLDPDRLHAALTKLPRPLGVTAAMHVTVLRGPRR